MSKTLLFKIATPEKVVFEAPAVDSISLPTKMGEITILPDHIPLVSVLVAGEIRVVVAGQEVVMAVSGGFIEVRPGQVIVLADTAERVEEIDETRAEQARAKAKELMEQQKTVEAENYAGLTAKIEKELARLKVVRKHKDRKTPSIHIE